MSNAQARWTQLHTRRTNFLRRCERYAAATIPKLCLPDDVTQDTASIQHGFQSLGAQAVNHLANKMMLALFAPSRPFFRLDPTPEFEKELGAQGVTTEALREALVSGETQAVRKLDQRAIRPKLYETLKHVIVTGNAMLDLSDETSARVLNIKRYVVKRSKSGKLIEWMIHEKVLFDELDEDAQAYLRQTKASTGLDKSTGAEERHVDYFMWAKLKDGSWTVTQHVDTIRLPGETFDSRFKENESPYHILAWDLADEHDYGTGLVEDYSGDFTSLETLSETEIKAAILASEFRWVLDSAGTTDPEDFRNTRSGDVVPGRKDDISLVSMSGRGALAEIMPVADRVIRRIGSAFLLGSAVTRDAERVTAEEIRMQAQELESSLGGVYSRLAVELQIPLVHWLLKTEQIEVRGTKLVPTIVTGLEALSRNADAGALASFLQDVGQVAAFPPEVLARLKMDSVLSTLAAARGLLASRYVKSDEQMQQEQQAAQAAAVAQAGAEAGAVAQAEQPTQQ